MKMLKMHQNTPTSMLKSENFSGVTPNPRIKRGGEGLGRVGKGENRLHPKFYFLTSEEMGEEIFRFP
jgi:hypothetical protein